MIQIFHKGFARVLDSAVSRLVLLSLCSGLLLLWHRKSFTHDTWWHLVVGDDILAAGKIPHEIYSFSARGAELHLHSWLSDAIFSALVSFGGLNMLELFAVLCSAGIAFLCARNARLMGASLPWAALVAVTFIAVSRTLLIIRPQLFSLLLLAWLFGRALQYLDGNTTKQLLIPLVIALWSNLHGAYVFGILVLFAFAVYGLTFPRSNLERRHALRLSAVALLSVVASGLNPGGYVQLASILQHDIFVQGPSAQIDEWLPSAFSKTPEFYITLVVGLCAVLWRRADISIRESAIFLLSLSMALMSWRHVAIYGVFGIPILGAWCSRVLPLTAGASFVGKGRGRLTTCAAAAAAAFVIGWQIFIRQDALESSVLRRVYPVAAARWIADNSPSGNMFNPYAWGGYLIFALRGKPPVYIDSRLVPYKGAVLAEYILIEDFRPGWQEALRNRGITWMVLRQDSTQAKRLVEEFGWKTLYRDNTAAVVALS